MRGSPFFEGVPQMEATFGPGTIHLPIFYYDGSALGAVFPARLSALRELLPDPRMCPARLAPGVGAVTVTCFEYRDTDVGVYNELAISVLLNEPWFLPNLPGRAVLGSLRRRQLNAYVHHLPVTTELALASGRDLYNYPKFVAGIEFDEGFTECRLSEGQEHILTVKGRRIATPRSEQVQLFSHLWMDRQPQSSEFKLNLQKLGISFAPGAASLELGGRHPIARELDGLLLSRRSIQYQYVPSFEGILYGPEHLSLPFIERVTARHGVGARAGS